MQGAGTNGDGAAEGLAVGLGWVGGLGMDGAGDATVGGTNTELPKSPQSTVESSSSTEGIGGE